MLLNTSVCIAVKGSSGEYEISNINIFSIDKIKVVSPLLEIKMYNKRDILFNVLCPFCNEYHYYKYNISEIIKREMLIGGCYTMGLPLIYIGRDKNVKEKAKLCNEINKRLYVKS